MVAATKPKKRARQREIEEGGRPIAGEDRVPEIDQLGAEFSEAVSERGAAGARCKELGNDLQKLMKQHRRKVYNMPDGSKLVLKHTEEDKVVVKKPKKPKDKDAEKKQGGRTGQQDFGGEN